MADWQEYEQEALAAILRLAYSGELAAALAYRGHWKSVRDPDERESVRSRRMNGTTAIWSEKART